MKTKFIILAATAVLFYCCQQKDWTDSNGNSITIDSVQFSDINNKTLKKWFLLNKESDSIMDSAQLIIQQQSDIVESYPQDEREYMNTNILEAQRHLNHFKNKVKHIREFVSHIEEYDPAMERTIDSLKEDYVQEKIKLEDALSKLR